NLRNLNRTKSTLFHNLRFKVKHFCLLFNRTVFGGAYKGRHQLFPPQGRLALMFLKNYSGLSDLKLIEQLNGNVEWQCFCGISLGFARITNGRVVSQIRCELAAVLNMKSVEQTLFDYWKPYISEPEKIVMDATCYESEVRYPTDVKLLWESVEWCYSRM